MADSDRLTIPGLTDDEQKWLDVLWAELVARRPRNLVRAGSYDFDRLAPLADSIIAPRYRNLGMVLGWTAKSVDMLARRCNIEGFYWPDGTLDDLGFTEMSEANNLVAELKAGLVSSLIHGPSFLVTTAGGTGEPASLVHVKDALNATGVWNSRTRALDAVLSITAWGGENERERPTGLVLYLNGLTVTAERAPGSRRWSIDRQSHQWGVPVDALVYKPRTGRSFGSSRITRPQMVLQSLAVRSVLRMEGHMDVYAIPQMILLGADESIFKNADGTQKAAIQVALGRVLGIPDDDDAASPELARAEVKQFPAQSPQPHLAQLSALAKLFAREASLPDAALAITDMANPTSADAYVAANDDLIAEAEGASDDWSLPLRRAVARALAIHNDEPVRPELGTLGVRWRSPLHVSRAAAADAGAKQIATVPWLAETEVGLELMGLTDDQIRRALAEKTRAQSRASLSALLARGVTADAVAE